MSEKQAKKIRELDRRLGVVEQFMVRVLQVMNEKHTKDMELPTPLHIMPSGDKWEEPTNDVEEFEDA